MKFFVEGFSLLTQNSECPSLFIYFIVQLDCRIAYLSCDRSLYSVPRLEPLVDPATLIFRTLRLVHEGYQLVPENYYIEELKSVSNS